MPIHHVTKTAEADNELLPDITGTNVRYAGTTKCNVEVIERVGAEPTVTAGAEGGAGSYTGTIKTQKTTILPDKKLDGAIVWETTTTLDTDGDSV